MLTRTASVLITSLAAAGLFAAAGIALRGKLRFSRTAVVVGVLHLAAVLANAVATEAAMLRPGPSEALMGWLWFDLVDFPSSILQILLGAALGNFMLREVLLPILFYGVLGSLQYLVLAELLVRFRIRHAQQPLANKLS